MDNKYQQITIALDTNYNKYPNLIKMWQVYLQIKKQRFIDDLQKCEQMLHKINHLSNDISPKSILTLYMLNCCEYLPVNT